MPSVCLFTSQRYGETFGGIETFVDSLSRWLSKKGVKVIVVARRLSFFRLVLISEKGEAVKPDAGALSVKPPLPYLAYLLHKLFYVLAAVFFIVRLNHKYHFTAIHCQDGFAGLSAALFKKVIRTPILGHSHGPQIYYHKSSTFRQAMSKVFDKYVGAHVDRMLVTDDITSSYYRLLGVPNDRVILVPSAIDLTPTERHPVQRMHRNRATKRSSKFIVGYVGRLSPEKNLGRLILAFAPISRRYSDARLVLVGDGHERKTLETLVSGIGLEKAIEFRGWRTDVQALLSLFDVFVLPSLFEGSPIALLEAMAAGKAIVASRIPSVRAMLKDGADALLVNPNSIDEIGKAILRLRRSSTLRARLGRHAKDVAGQYDVDVIYERILSAYESVHTIPKR